MTSLFSEMRGGDGAEREECFASRVPRCSRVVGSFLNGPRREKHEEERFVLFFRRLNWTVGVTLTLPWLGCGPGQGGVRDQYGDEDGPQSRSSSIRTIVEPCERERGKAEVKSSVPKFSARMRPYSEHEHGCRGSHRDTLILALGVRPRIAFHTTSSTTISSISFVS
jgi:hypothetical protein